MRDSKAWSQPPKSFSKTQNQNICLDESYEHLLCIKHVINFSMQSISSIFYASMSSIFYAGMSKLWALAQNIFLMNLMNDYWHACGKNFLQGVDMDPSSTQHSPSIFSLDICPKKKGWKHVKMRQLDKSQDVPIGPWEMLINTPQCWLAHHPSNCSIAQFCDFNPILLQFCSNKGFRSKFTLIAKLGALSHALSIQKKNLSYFSKKKFKIFKIHASICKLGALDHTSSI